MITKNGKRSCHDRLQKLRKEFGISKKEYGKAPPPITGRTLPVIDLSPTKKEKKKQKKQLRKKQYKLAWWYLNDYLRPCFAQEIYDQFDDVEELTDYACKEALMIIENFRYDPKDRLTWDQWVKKEEARMEREVISKKAYMKGIDLDNAPGRPIIYINENADIPEIYWPAFELYCDEHPIKNNKQAKKRRIKFIKMVNKQYMKTYGKVAKGKTKHDNWNTNDMLSLCVDTPEMMESLRRHLKKSVAHADNVRKQMEKWFTHIDCDPEVKKKLLKHHDKVASQASKKVDEFLKDLERMGKIPKGTQVEFSYAN